MKFKCRTCGEEKQKIKSEYIGSSISSFKYRDEHGYKWNGRDCPDCSLAKNKHRKSSYEKPLDPIHALGAAAEDFAKRHFESLGFSVRRGKGKGPDLFISAGTFKITCEVKRICKHNGSYRINSVKERRKKDDLIAMVFEDKFIHIEDMADHLLAVDKSGSRSVLKILREHEIVN